MSSAAESFLYIWYDTKNKMFYLGKHKGTPDDSYTHSSTIMESFSKDNIPSHMKRRILAYGTDEEMCLLEHECLKNRKEKKWERYYNQSLGSPWLDQWGENNPFYKHGMTGDPEWKKKRDREYHLKNKEHRNKLSREWRKNNLEYVRARDRERDKIRYQDPEYRRKQIENMRRNYKKRMEDSEYREEYLKKNRERCRKWREENRDEYNARKREQYRAKKLAQQTGATLPL